MIKESAAATQKKEKEDHHCQWQSEHDKVHHTREDQLYNQYNLEPNVCCSWGKFDNEI